MKQNNILLENLISETYKMSKDPFQRSLFQYQNKQLASMMEDYASNMETYPMPITTRFYETILTQDNGIGFMSRLQILELEKKVNSESMLCKEPILDLLNDAASHIRGCYEEPFYARFLRAAYSVQGAETLIHAASKDNPAKSRLSTTATSRFISLYATLMGVSFTEEKSLARDCLFRKAA